MLVASRALLALTNRLFCLLAAQSSLEWLHCQTPAIALQFLEALRPLLRQHQALHDFTVRIVQKLLFQSSVEARLLAVQALFILVECPYDSRAAQRHGSSAFAASQAASQYGGAVSSVDESFFRDAALVAFRRALVASPQEEVRVVVYDRLQDLYRLHPTVRPAILELLQLHLTRYLHDKNAESSSGTGVGVAVRPPLKLEAVLDASRSRVIEPLPKLISTCMKMLLREGPTEGLPHGDGAEISASQLQHIDPEQHSAAQLRQAIHHIMQRLSTIRKLKELGVSESQIVSATADDPAGVAAVLQAQTLHGVLCCFFEWQLKNEQNAPSVSVLHPEEAPNVAHLSEAACRTLLHLFDNIYSLYDLLTTPPKAEKKVSSSSASAAKKKKKKKKADDDDEEEEEEEEEEEGEEEDEEENDDEELDEENEDADEEEEDEDDEEEGGKGRSKQKKKSASKAKKKRGGGGAAGAKPRVKQPAKAVVALSRHGRWKQYTLTPTAISLMLQLSTPNSGDPISRGGARRSAAQATEDLAQHFACVGDALYGNINLQRWLCINMIHILEEYERRSVTKLRARYDSAAVLMHRAHVVCSAFFFSVFSVSSAERATRKCCPCSWAGLPHWYR